MYSLVYRFWPETSGLAQSHWQQQRNAYEPARMPRLFPQHSCIASYLLFAPLLSTQLSLYPLHSTTRPTTHSTTPIAMFGFIVNLEAVFFRLVVLGLLL